MLHMAWNELCSKAHLCLRSFFLLLIICFPATNSLQNFFRFALVSFFLRKHTLHFGLLDDSLSLVQAFDHFFQWRFNSSTLCLLFLAFMLFSALFHKFNKYRFGYIRLNELLFCLDQCQVDVYAWHWID